MLLTDVVRSAIDPALQVLPRKFDSREARVLMLTIGLQESRFEYRRQMGNGPARGFWQFEEGTRASRGGVWGVYLHSASADLLRQLCHERDVPFDPHAIWAALEQDDVLAAGVARLMLFTNPKPLPAVGDADGGWAYYLNTWRPGKPHPETWPALYAQALAVVKGA